MCYDLSCPSNRFHPIAPSQKRVTRLIYEWTYLYSGTSTQPTVIHAPLCSAADRAVYIPWSIILCNIWWGHAIQTITFASKQVKKTMTLAFKIFMTPSTLSLPTVIVNASKYIFASLVYFITVNIPIFAVCFWYCLKQCSPLFSHIGILVANIMLHYHNSSNAEDTSLPEPTMTQFADA